METGVEKIETPDKPTITDTYRSLSSIGGLAY
jgi:hypothetical protein